MRSDVIGQGGNTEEGEKKEDDERNESSPWEEDLARARSRLH